MLGGYPIPFLGGYPTSGLGDGGTPSQVWGVPHRRSGWGVPHLRLGGTPSQVWTGGAYPIQSRLGVPRVPPLSRPGMGYPPDLGWGTPPDLSWGTPLPRPEMGTPYPDLRWGTPLQVWTDTQTRVKTLPSLVLRTRAVIISLGTIHTERKWLRKRHYLKVFVFFLFYNRLAWLSPKAAFVLNTANAKHFL